MAGSEEVRAEAEELIRKVKTADPDIVTSAIVMTMKRHYIRGGIDALESILSSLPEKLMDLPPEQLKVLSAMVGILEQFEQVLRDKLKKADEKPHE